VIASTYLSVKMSGILLAVMTNGEEMPPTSK